MEVEKEVRNKVKRPLRGQSFFLYLRRRTIDEAKLHKWIEQLGGKLDRFFSKEVTCLLVDDDFESQCSGLRTACSTFESTSPLVTTSPNTESDRSNSLAPFSRGFALLQRSKETTDDCPNNSKPKQTLIEKAQTFGIKIIRISKFLERIRAEVMKHKKSESEIINDKVIVLTGSVIKVEDTARKFRPHYKTFTEEPRLFFENEFYGSPFDSLPVPQNPKTVKRFSSHTKSATEILHSKLKFKMGKDFPKITKPQKRHYCECCKVAFHNLNRHVNGTRHQNFVQNRSNYDCVWAIMQWLPNVDEFLEKKKNEQCDVKNTESCAEIGQVST